MIKFPVYQNQRFFPFGLNEVFDKDSHIVQEFVKNRDYMTIASDILTLIRYPFKNGKPDDEHSYSAFNGIYHYNRKIKDDYWQKGEETISILVGDCEDSSIAFVSCMRAKGVSEKDVYEVFGYVTTENGEFLGGHGWAVSRFIPDNEIRLNESTLDFPPSEYPIVEDIRKPFKYHGMIYVPEMIFNDKEFEEVKTMTKIGNLEIENKSNYFMQRKNKKRRIKKHITIARAFNRHSRVEKEIGRSLLGLIRYGKTIRGAKTQRR